MKKVLALLVCFIMILSGTAFASGEESTEKILTDFFNTYKDILFLDTNAKVEVAFLADVDNDKEPELVVSAGAYFYGLAIYKVQDGTVKLHDKITCERGTGINENYYFLLDVDGSMYLIKDKTNAQIPSDYTIYTFKEYDLGKSSSEPEGSLVIKIPTDDAGEAYYSVEPDGEQGIVPARQGETMVETFRNEFAPYIVWSRDDNGKYIDLETIWSRQKALQNGDSSVCITLQIGKPEMAINGISEIVPSENAPVIKNKRTLVPEVIVKKLGGTVLHSGNGDGKITISYEDSTIELAQGSNTATVNGNTVTLDAAPIIVNDTTMLPIRFIAESFGATVEWEEATKKVTITKN